MSDQPCDEYIKELEEEILTLKSEIDKLEGRIDDLNDEIDDLNDEITDLENVSTSIDIQDETELINERLNLGDTLWDEYKKDFFAEYHTQYTPWELELILKNGHKLLKQ
jgi:predicted  nucleic acid-binding Zn-ribbon protein